MCWLYIKGGVYIDIDLELTESLDDIIKDKDYSLTMGLSYENFIKRPFNAIIISDKGNKKIKECIIAICNINLSLINNKKNYTLILYTMKKILGEEFHYRIKEKNIRILYPVLEGDWKLFLDNKIIGNSKYKNYKDGKFR